MMRREERTHPCCSRASASSMTTVLSSTKKLKSMANPGFPSRRELSPDMPQSIFLGTCGEATDMETEIETEIETETGTETGKKQMGSRKK